MEIFRRNLVCWRRLTFWRDGSDPNTKPEVKLRLSCRHLENRYNITPPRIFRFWCNLAGWRRIACRSRWHRKSNSDMADVCFSKPEIVISQKWIEYSGEIWFADRDWHSEETDVSQSETGSKLCRSDRRLENRYHNTITPRRMVRFGCNLAAWCRITCRLRRYGRSRYRKKNPNMADVCFSKRK